MSPSRPAPSPIQPGADTTVRCPGCGSVLIPAAGDEPAPAGVSPACARLFEETLRGVREDAAADPRAAAAVGLADATYTAQHPGTAGPQRLREALDDLAGRLGAGPSPAPGHPADAGPPAAWRTTVADVAADLDVIDLLVLVESWARAVLADWQRRDDGT